MADHPQYSEKKLSKYRDSPYIEFTNEGIQKTSEQIENLKKIHANQQEMKLYAWKIGCSKLNPSFFYIKYILCDTFIDQKNQTEHKKQNLFFDNQKLSDKQYTEKKLIA